MTWVSRKTLNFWRAHRLATWDSDKAQSWSNPAALAQASEPINRMNGDRPTGRRVCEGSGWASDHTNGPRAWIA